MKCVLTTHQQYHFTVIYTQTLQSAQYRDRSTMTVSTHVFLAPVPVKSLTKSALHCVPAGVGVLLAQWLTKKLMHVSMFSDCPKDGALHVIIT